MAKKIRKDIERAWQYLAQEKKNTVLKYLQFLEELPHRKNGVIDLLFEGVYLDEAYRLQGREKWLALPHGDFILLWYLGMRAKMGDLRIRYLEELDLRLWNIDKFPSNFHELKNLKRLKLKGNIGSIPSRVEDIVVDEDTLHNIRPWLQELTIQPKLFLEIERPEAFIPDLFEDIYGIRFARKIDAIPYWLQHYKNIRYLRIPFHEIQKFPYWFSEFVELEELEIGPAQQDKKTEISDSLGELKKLRKLVCARLGWSALPSWVCKLPRLEYLDIQGNQIEELPQTLKNLTKLNYLELQRNPLRVFPEILNQMETLRLVLVDFHQRKSWAPHCQVPLQLAVSHHFKGTV